jgi:hypothetical protein
VPPGWPFQSAARPLSPQRQEVPAGGRAAGRSWTWRASQGCQRPPPLWKSHDGTCFHQSSPSRGCLVVHSTGPGRSASPKVGQGRNPAVGMPLPRRNTRAAGQADGRTTQAAGGAKCPRRPLGAIGPAGGAREVPERWLAAAATNGRRDGVLARGSRASSGHLEPGPSAALADTARRPVGTSQRPSQALATGDPGLPADRGPTPLPLVAAGSPRVGGGPLRAPRGLDWRPRAPLPAGRGGFLLDNLW